MLAIAGLSAAARLGGVQLFLGCKPQSLGAFQSLDNFGVFPLPKRDVLGIAG